MLRKSPWPFFVFGFGTMGRKFASKNIYELNTLIMID